MEAKYAGSEILQMAVEIEKHGKAFYDSVVRVMKNPQAREIFQFLSDEEERHEVIFRKMLQEVHQKNESGYDDETVTFYFRSLIEKKVFPTSEEAESMEKDLGDPLVAIHIALSLEKESILFYHELLPVTNEKDHPVIDKIIDEERDHIQRILKLKSDLQL
ncbi:ferritin family protein [bacterium]|nr:ferritin family protein [bacterium]RQV98312.1 MAG: hypothetical protein EH221_02195 [bacterium]